MRRVRALAVLVAATLAGCGGASAPEQDGPVLGDGDALVVVATSVGCEQCAELHREAVPRIVERYVEPGDARLRTVLLVPADDAAARMTAAIRAAGVQDRLLEALDAAFAPSPPRDAEALLRSVDGLDVPRALADMQGPEVAAAAAADRRVAGRAGIDAAPTVLVGRRVEEIQPIRSPNLSVREITKALDELTGSGAKDYPT